MPTLITRARTPRRRLRDRIHARIAAWLELPTTEDYAAASPGVHGA